MTTEEINNLIWKIPVLDKHPDENIQQAMHWGYLAGARDSALNKTEKQLAFIKNEYRGP